MARLLAQPKLLVRVTLLSASTLEVFASDRSHERWARYVEHGDFAPSRAGSPMLEKYRQRTPLGETPPHQTYRVLDRHPPLVHAFAHLGREFEVTDCRWDLGDHARFIWSGEIAV